MSRYTPPRDGPIPPHSFTLCEWSAAGTLGASRIGVKRARLVLWVLLAVAVIALPGGLVPGMLIIRRAVQ